MSAEELAPALRELAERYEIVREVGRGGMARVFLAHQLATGRMVAIKTIDARHADDAEAMARFAREAHTVAALDHLNVVRTLSVEEVGDGVAAIVMEYVPGGTLRELLRAGGPLSFERAEEILRDVAEALRYAHGRGLVHRDVKPENIFLDEEEGRALLSDFGIARLIEDASRLTLTGTSIGTPTYMSPEQIDGKKLDGRTDIYSLGLVGWEMLAGARPWEGESLYKVIYKQKHEELPRLTVLRPDIPEHLLFAIEGALHKDRETRWADLREFLDELGRRIAPTVPVPPVADLRPAELAPSDLAQADLAPADSAAAEITAAESDGADAVAPPFAVDRDAELSPRDEPVAPTWSEQARLRSVAEDPWSEPYVPGTPEEEARRDAEALGRLPRRPWRALLARTPDGEPLHHRSRLLLPLALAAVALIAVAGGVRSRPSSPRVAADVDSLTRATSAGELDPGAATAAPVAARAPDGASASGSVGATSAPATSGGPRSVKPTRPPARTAAPARSRRPVAATPRPPSSTRRPRTHGDSLALCSTPGIVEQQACLGAALHDRDVGLNNVYQTLIREMRRQERVPAGAPDPPSVQALRAQQRQWLVTRDAECRREVSAASGPLWAAPRIRCLGREGVVRAGVLADRLTRLRAP